MLQLLESLKAEGAAALTKGALVLCGAGAFGAAAILFAAALTVGLAALMPLYAALLCSAALLVLVGAACLGSARAGKPKLAAPHAVAAHEPFHLSEITYRALEDELRRRPGKAAAAAVVAGFVLGALEALEKWKTSE
ncbi:MAG: hypothetical protein ACKVS5_07270 [Parvularculaceae bacterium]